MAPDPHDRSLDPARAPSEQDEISSLFLASDLVIEQFVRVLLDFLPVGAAADEPAHGDARSRPPRRRLARAPTVATDAGPEPWTVVMAARCAILLQRELDN